MPRNIFAFFMYSSVSSPILALGSSSIACFGSSLRRLDFFRRARIALPQVRFLGVTNLDGQHFLPAFRSLSSLSPGRPFCRIPPCWPLPYIPSIARLSLHAASGTKTAFAVSCRQSGGIVEMCWGATDQISVFIPSRLPSGKDK